MQPQTNTVSADWVKWAVGVALGLNSLCVGYVVKGENRLTKVEEALASQKQAYDQHLADNREVRADIYARLKNSEEKQAAVLEAIGGVKVDVAAIRGALGIKRQPAE